MKEYSATAKGLVKDLDNFQLSPEQYTHALNLVIESVDGSSFLPQNDSSNLLGWVFEEGENVLYKKYISELNKIILFTTKNRVLELSLSKYNDRDFNLPDYEEGSIPVNIPLTPVLTGKVLAQSPCFNWNIEHRVDMVYKITDSTFNMYFVDGGYNEDRYLYFNLDDFSIEDTFKQIIGYQNGKPVYSNNIDCNTLKWYPDISYPQITTKATEGGKLKAGVYQFLVSYATSKGVALTNYKSATNPFHLSTTQQTVETDYDTGKAIIVKVDDLDINGRYRYINIAVAETINEVTTFRQIATLPVNEEVEYTYTGNTVTTPLDETVIFQLYPFYRSSDGITKANDRVFKHGLKEFERFNLQPLAPYFKTKWFTITAQEGDYVDPNFAQDYRGYLRDESYIFGIEFLSDNGEKIPVVTLIGREKTLEDQIPVTITNKDNPLSEDFCNTPETKEAWEVYNTAKVTKTYDGELDRCNYKMYQEGDFAYHESTELYPNDESFGELANTPIRLFKYPDCLVSPFHNGNDLKPVQFNEKSLIYPIGIKLDDSVNVQDILQLGVNLGYISEEQKNRITGYKFVRGNRVGNESITGKGYLYNNKQYFENGRQVRFANYPFNDLRRDSYLAATPLDKFSLSDYNDPANHVEFVETNSYTVHSPEFAFASPSLGTVLKVEEEISGEARGAFHQSVGQSEYVILSQTHYNFAILIAWLLTSRLKLSEAQPGSQGQAIGGSIGGVVGGVVGSIFPAIGTAAGAIVGSGLGSVIGRLVGANTANDDYNFMYRQSMWISQTDRILELLNNTIPLQNYHWQYHALGKYKNATKVENAGFKVRRIKASAYLDSTRQVLPNDVYFNNNRRESSVYVELDSPVGTPVHVDNSRFTMSETGDCELNEGEEVRSNISSFYVSLKREILNQYGTVYSIEWIPTSNKTFGTDEIGQDFGGDAFIVAWGIKRQMSFFTNTSFNLPDRTDYYYEDQHNIAYPRFFFNTKYSELSEAAQISIKQLASLAPSTVLMLALNNIETPKTITDNKVDTAFVGDLQDSIGALMKYTLMDPYRTVRPGRYNIDCNKNDFVSYPGDTVKTPASSSWWQNTVGEGDVDRYVPNAIFNFAGVKGKIYTYSYGVPYYLTESTINLDLRHTNNVDVQDFYPHITDLNRWLQPVIGEVSTEPINYDNLYLYNRSYSKQNKEDILVKNDINFFKNKDKIYFQNRAIYSQSGSEVDNADFKDNYLYYRPLDFKDLSFENGKLISLDSIEDQKILARFENTMRIYNAYSTVKANNTTLILGNGSIFDSYQQFSNTELGYIGSQHVDMLNTPFGHIIVDAKRGNVFNLRVGGEGIEELTKDGMRNWFTENLPFKISKYFPEVDIDNPYNGLGLALSYDNRLKRIFITKKDYIPLESDITYKEGEFYKDGQKIDLDSKSFCNASWTISYSFYTKSWISFHSFTPNYYIDEIDIFHTGLNGLNRGKSSLWVHNLTNKSYQVYYNKLYPFEIESVNKSTLEQSILTEIQFKLDSIRYHNDSDRSPSLNNIAFNKAIVSTDFSNSGLLELDLVDENDLFKIRQYPIVEEKSTKILLRKKEAMFSFNQFSNIAKENNLPRFLSTCNNVNKVLNLKALDYKNFRVDNNYIRGDKVFVRLINDKHKDYKLIYKGMLSDSIQSIR